MQQLATLAGVTLLAFVAGCANDGLERIPLRESQWQLSEAEVRAQFQEISTEWTRYRGCHEVEHLLNDGQVFMFAPVNHFSGVATLIIASCWVDDAEEPKNAICRLGRDTKFLFRNEGRLIQYSGPNEDVDLADLVDQFESSLSEFWRLEKSDLVAIDVQGSHVNYKLYSCSGCFETLKAYRPSLGDQKLIFAEETTDQGCY